MKTRPLPSFPPQADLPRSALPRAIDLNYPSNRFVVVGAVAAAVAARLLGQRPLQALGVGLAGLAGWSSARELDPDFPRSAEVALPIAAAAAFLAGVPNPVASFSVMSSLRVLSASVGYKPSETDILLLAAQSILAGLSGERVAAALPGAALGMSAQQQDELSPERGTSVMAASALLPDVQRLKRRSILSDLVVLAALSTLGTLERPEAIASQRDQSAKKVSAGRVQRARQLALSSLAASLLLGQTRSLTPLAAAVLSTGWRRGAVQKRT